MPQRGEYGAIEVRADCNPSSKAYLGSMFWELRALDGENYFCHLEQTRTETGAEESAAICLNIEKGKTLGKKLLMTRVGSTQGDEVEFRGTVQ